MSNYLGDWDFNSNNISVEEQPSVFRTENNQVPVEVVNISGSAGQVISTSIISTLLEGEKLTFSISLKTDIILSSVKFFVTISSTDYGCTLTNPGGVWQFTPLADSTCSLTELNDDWANISVEVDVSEGPINVSYVQKIELGLGDKVYTSDYISSTNTLKEIILSPNAAELPPLPHNWSGSFDETLEYVTKVTATAKGVESRKSLGDRPTRTLTCNFSGLDAEKTLKIVQFIRNTALQEYYLPLYRDEALAVASSDQGETEIFVQGSPELCIGQKVLLARHSDSEIIDRESQASEVLTGVNSLKLSSAASMFTSSPVDLSNGSFTFRGFVKWNSSTGLGFENFFNNECAGYTELTFHKEETAGIDYYVLRVESPLAAVLTLTGPAITKDVFHEYYIEYDEDNEIMSFTVEGVTTSGTFSEGFNGAPNFTLLGRNFDGPNSMEGHLSIFSFLNRLLTSEEKIELSQTDSQFLDFDLVSFKNDFLFWVNFCTGSTISSGAYDNLTGDSDYDVSVFPGWSPVFQPEGLEILQVLQTSTEERNYQYSEVNNISYSFTSSEVTSFDIVGQGSKVLTTPDDYDLLGRSFTWMGMVKYTSSSGSLKIILDKFDNSGSDGFRISLVNPFGGVRNLRFAVGGGGIDFVDSSNKVPLETWTFFATSYNHITGDMKVVVDETETLSNFSGTFKNPVNNLSIGGNSPVTDSTVLSGNISTLGCIERYMTLSEILINKPSDPDTGYSFERSSYTKEFSLFYDLYQSGILSPSGTVNRGYRKGFNMTSSDSPKYTPENLTILENLGDTSIIGITDPLDQKFSPPWSLYPCISCDVQPSQTAYNLLTSQIIGSSSVSGTEKDGPSKIPEKSYSPDTFNNLPIFPIVPDYNGISISVTPSVEVINFPAGDRVDPVNYSDKIFNWNERNVEKSNALLLENFFKYCKGRGESFLFRSPSNDIFLKEDQTSLSSVAAVRVGSIFEYQNYFKYVYLQYRDGSDEYLEISSIQDINEQFKIFTKTDRSQLDIAFATFAYVCRFNSDSLTTSWITTTHSSTSLSLRTLKFSGVVPIPYLGVNATSPTDIFIEGAKFINTLAICFNASEVAEDSENLGTLTSDDFFGKDHIYELLGTSPNLDKFEIVGDVLRRTQKLSEGSYEVDVRSINNLGEFIDQTLTVYAKPSIPLQVRISIDGSSVASQAFVIANPVILSGVQSFELPREDSSVTRVVDGFEYWQDPVISPTLTREVDVVKDSALENSFLRLSFRDTANIVAGQSCTLLVELSQNGGAFSSLGTVNHPGTAEVTTVEIPLSINIVCPL